MTEQSEPLSFNAWRRKHNIAAEPLHVSDGEKYATYRVEYERKQLRIRIKAVDIALKELAEEWRTGEDWQGVDDAAAPHCAKGLDALRIRLLTITPDKS